MDRFRWDFIIGFLLDLLKNLLGVEYDMFFFKDIKSRILDDLIDIVFLQINQLQLFEKLFAL